MEDGHTLFDYDVGLNDIVQLMIRVNLPEVKDTTESDEKELSSDNEPVPDDDNNVRILIVYHIHA